MLTPEQIKAQLKATARKSASRLDAESRGQWDLTLADVVGRELLYTDEQPRKIITPNNHPGYVCVCVFVDEVDYGAFRLLVDAAACTEIIDLKIDKGWKPQRATAYAHTSAKGRLYYAYRKPEEKAARKGGRR